MENKEIKFICECNSEEHQTKFILDKDGELIMISHIHQYRNIFKRILVAIRYILGYKCEYGEWDVFTFKESDKKKLSNYLKGNKRLTKEEIYHLKFIYNRMLVKYNENHNFDYMLKLKEIIEKLDITEYNN